MWSCSTCTSRGEAGTPCSVASCRTTPRCNSSPSPCPTPPRTSSTSSGPAPRGYITKTISGPELLQAVYRVAAGDAVFSPRLAGFVLDAFAQVGAPAPGLDPELDQLSPREREVLRLIARGYTYKEVGRDLSISAKTVESHVSSVLRKLQLSTRHELTRWATDRRLV